MRNTNFVTINPDRQNTKYVVQEVGSDPAETFQWLISALRKNCCSTDKTIIYCRSIKDCHLVYQAFIGTLGAESYYPEDSPKISRNRLFSMYHRSTKKELQESIIESLTNPEGICRVVIATVALGLGINFSDIRYIINYGPPNTIEQYIQQCGRGGRDGLPALALLLWHRRQLKTAGSDMLKFLRSEKCRRESMLTQLGWKVQRDYIPKHSCCDWCSKVCSCESLHHCLPLEEIIMLSSSSRGKTCDTSNDLVEKSSEERFDVTEEERSMAVNYLKEAQEAIAQLKFFGGSSSIPMLYNKKVATGLSDEMIFDIAEKCNKIITVEDCLREVPALRSRNNAEMIVKILDDLFSKPRRVPDYSKLMAVYKGDEVQ